MVLNEVRRKRLSNAWQLSTLEVSSFFFYRTCQTEKIRFRSGPVGPIFRLIDSIFRTIFDLEPGYC